MPGGRKLLVVPLFPGVWQTGVPVANQTLLFQGARLRDDSLLNGCGVKDSDMLLM